MSIKKTKNPAPASKLGLRKTTKPLDNNTSANQRTAILTWFTENKPRLSTMEARQKLGIMSPASRILEIRRMGYSIDLYWSTQIDPNGISHRAGEYVYFGRREKSA